MVPRPPETPKVDPLPTVNKPVNEEGVNKPSLVKDDHEKTAEKAPLPPRDLGKGGAQHRAIQQRLKATAESFGFRAIIEKEILGGLGSVDLLLERNEQTLACEISSRPR